MIPSLNRFIFHLLLLILSTWLSSAQYLQSPCPDIFTYQVDPVTGQTFGLIEVNGNQAEQVIKLNVDLTIGTRLSQGYFGSISLIKSREDTVRDISQGLPAQYRVNFPLRDILPAVQSIAVNGQIVCSGNRAQGRIVTTINLRHALFFQLQTQYFPQSGIHSQGPFQSNAVIYQPRPRPPPDIPHYQARPQPIPEWNIEPSYTSRPLFTQPTVPQTTSIIDDRPSTVRIASPSTSTSDYVCGRPSDASISRLALNGKHAEKGQFPWIVPLFDRTQKQNPKYFCGSTIITKKHLVTTASCVYKTNDYLQPERILAVPGMYHIDNFLDDNAKFADVQSVIPNSEYAPEEDLSDADLAILVLTKSLDFSDYIIPICSWKDENDVRKIVGLEGYVAGWGLTEHGRTSVFPTYIKAIVVDKRQCAAKFLQMFPSNSRTFCGDGQDATPCIGDSGNGMVLKRGNQFYLRGVVSKSQIDPNTLKCDVTKYSIYTDVAHFQHWLSVMTSQ
ncbi:serine protease gd-like [Toxorhynchites rutilus septentrionalis]|uniref:serine protease gd-like n=1 Tax=Toxorhynchites rutilus septentrionalis TaxID=329112 RepID=UPI002479F083|nr:serine protease gd-like [Toxorhynchites rutilus septentrionalis]